MRVLLIGLFAGMIFGQSPKLPPDIDPRSNSRLPLIQRDQLNDDEKKIFDDVANTAPGRVVAVQSTDCRVHPDAQFWPAGYRARFADVRNLRIDRGREFDEDFEWTGDLAGAKRAGAPERTIQAILFNGDLMNVPAKDALMIRFARALFRENKASPELYADVVKDVRTTGNGRSGRDHG